MSEQWQFERDDQSLWRWKRTDDAQGEVDSTDAFPSEIDCMMDAVRYAVQRRRNESLQ